MGLGILTVLVLAGCAPARGGGSAPSAAAVPSGPKTLHIAAQVEPLVIGKALRSSGNSQGMTNAALSADLTYIDENKGYKAQLAQSLPTLNSDAWRVNTDGTMQTTFKLRPNLTWHDGTPLSAEDWVFGYKVFMTPEYGTASSIPQRYISDVSAPDPQTVVFNWSALYTEADGMFTPPLPRHILQAQFEKGDADAFVAHLWWTREYVGLGPYKITRWEPGAFIEADAFDGFVLGRAKIDKLHWVFIGDPSVVVGNFLAQTVDIGFDNIFRLEQTETLKQQWQPGEGTVLIQLAQVRRNEFQRRAEFQKPVGLLDDVRARRALLYALDRVSLNEGLLRGQSRPIDTFALPNDPFFEEAERASMKYPFDPRVVQQLLTEIGFTRGSDNFWVHPQFGRFSIGMQTLDGTQNVQEMTILADLWKQQGIEITQYVVPPAQVQDNQVRSQFPGLSATSAGAIETYTKAMTATANNRWQGSNRGAWPGSDEYEALVTKFTTTLDRPARYTAIAQASKIVSEDVAALPLLYNPQVIAFRNVLSGVVAPLTAYNIHEWTMK